MRVPPCRYEPAFRKTKSANQPKRDFDEFQSPEVDQTSADTIIQQTRQLDIKEDFFKDLKLLWNVLKRTEKPDKARKDVFSLRSRAIKLLTEEVGRHKINTKKLEEMGQCLSTEETTDYKQLHSLGQARVMPEKRLRSGRTPKPMPRPAC